MSRLFLVALRRRFVVWLVAATLLAFGTPLGGPALAQSDRAAGELVVKKDRITSITILDRPPRCQCRNAAGTDPPANRTCVS